MNDGFEQELATIKKLTDPPERVSDEEYEKRIREIVKCKRDIVYFAEKYYRIVNLDRGLEIIKLYDVQKDFLRFLTKNNKVVCTSGRQQGKSTIYCIYTLWLTIFFPEKKVMILANKEVTAIELVSRIEMAYSYLPYWLKPAVTIYNRGEMMFATKSGVKCFASSSDAARGWSANCVILDEAAFVPKNIADKLFTSIFPIISSSENGKIILVSTPNGTGNLFYDIWKIANSHDGNSEGWKPFEMWWWQVPGHDEKWKKAQIAAIGKERFAQEFNNEFIAGSTFQKLLPDDVIEKFRIATSKEKKLHPEFVAGKELQIFSENQGRVFPFTMWHEFDPERTYAAAADIAEGLGGSADSSVLYIFDITDLSRTTLCAKFSSNSVTPVEFAFVCNKILSLYANPYFICERNGVGAPFIDIMKVTYEYPNLVKEGRHNEYGIRSIGSVKLNALLWMKQMFTTVGYGWEIYDEALFSEMSTFIKDARSNNSVYKAAVGAHDDLVLTLCWICWLLSSEVVEKYFIVADTMKTEFDEILPLRISQQFNYTQNEIRTAIEDPLYRQYVSHKESMVEQYRKAMEQEASSKDSDPFFSMFNPNRENFQRPQYQFRKTFAINSSYDGFSDPDFDGPEW